MTRRIARSSTVSHAQRPAARNKQKRAIDALSIAARQQPDKPRVRQNRLGESEEDKHDSKRRRLHSGEEIDDQTHGPQPTHRGKDVGDGSDAEHGSDSEGHVWQMGNVDVENDSDLDSDEAFGDSDDERFEAFTFRGSSKSHSSRRSKSGARPVAGIEEDFNLDEEDKDNGSVFTASGTEDDFGEDAVDLATALDRWEGSDADGSDDEQPKNSERHPTEDDVDSGESFSGFSSDADQVEDDPNAAIKMQSIISSFAPDAYESKETVASKGRLQPLAMENLLSAHDNPAMRKSLRKHIKTKSNGKNAQQGTLEVPLPKRQQDRLDRAAASQKAKETLDQWVDTVKHNRRAEHLAFPLRDDRSAEVSSRNRLSTTVDNIPFNELESVVQNILQESGLSSKSKSDQEDQIRAFEQLQTNKMSLAEAQARQSDLRKMRELLFREEVKAKRIKRIKSKAYRRVHRRERERVAQAEKEALVATGVDLSDEERERHDRRRAEARMGAKHRNSKWAKEMRQTGRAAWDEDAREGVTEMAKQKDELMQRIQGKPVLDEGHNSDLSSDNDEAYGSELQDLAPKDQERRRLRRRLDRLDDRQTVDEPHSRLHEMAFMQKAENARNARNQQDIERLKHELDADEEESEESRDDEGPVGRRSFSSSKNAAPESAQNKTFHEFEEVLPSDEDENADLQLHGTKKGDALDRSDITSQPARREKTKSVAPKKLEITNTDVNPWLADHGKNGKGHLESKTTDLKSRPTNTVESNRLQLPSKSQQSTRPANLIKASVTVAEQPAIGDVDEAKLAPFVLRNQDLVQKAFAGDDVVADFEAEKKADVVEEGEKVIDRTLPGWGSWVGEGISAKERNRQKGRFVEKEVGIKASDRRDANLDRVIMNEKRIKKNTKYLAPGLPHPYESQAQYERALRLPMGPEWTTKETFQTVTKPRVMVKQGVIAPMSRPMI